MEFGNEREAQVFEAMLRARVEQCLREVWAAPALCHDDDGDVPFRWGTAACWVRVEPGDTRSVSIFAYAATGVRRSAKLLAELNDITMRSRLTRSYHTGDLVVVAAELPWSRLDPAALDELMTAVGTVADDIGGLIAAMFDGELPFPAEPEAQHESSEADDDAA